MPAANSGMNEVLGNHISLTMTTLLTAGALIKAGKVVPLAVTSLQRHPAYPDIPTFAEQGFPDVRGDTWFWLAGPKNLPADIVNRLNAEVRRINKTPKMRSISSNPRCSPRTSTRPLSPNSSPTNTPSGRPVAKEAGLTVQ